MDKQTISQLEGVAALDRRHHDTTKATGRRCCQISWQNWIIIGLLVFSTIGGGKGLRLSAEVDQLRSQLNEANAKAQNESWLWNSQALLVATFEDDPTKLDGEPWDFFVTHATLNRMEGFLLIINDGNHPRLAEWHELQTISKSVIRK